MSCAPQLFVGEHYDYTFDLDSQKYHVWLVEYGDSYDSENTGMFMLEIHIAPCSGNEEADEKAYQEGTLKNLKTWQVKISTGELMNILQRNDIYYVGGKMWKKDVYPQLEHIFDNITQEIYDVCSDLPRAIKDEIKYLVSDCYRSLLGYDDYENDYDYDFD